jgi:hypothetical protein
MNLCRIIISTINRYNQSFYCIYSL